jgi:hypothetical protein
MHSGMAVDQCSGKICFPILLKTSANLVRGSEYRLHLARPLHENVLEDSHISMGVLDVTGQ